MQTFLHSQKEDSFRENRLCHLEKPSKSPEAIKKDPKEEPKKESPKRKEATQDVAETLEPRKKLTAAEAYMHIHHPSMGLRYYESVTPEGLKLIVAESEKKEGTIDFETVDFSGLTKIGSEREAELISQIKCKSLMLDGLEKMTGNESYYLAKFKGKKISLKNLKLDPENKEDLQVLQDFNFFKGEILNRYIATPFGLGGRLLFKYDNIRGHDYVMCDGARPLLNEPIDMSKKFKFLNYDFNGTGSSETESREKFTEEVVWRAHKRRVSPLSIIWEEIFPKGASINFTGGKVTADTFNENLEVLDKVENWIVENL